MGEFLGQQLEAASNQAAAQQLQQASELQALQHGMAGRLASQEGAISAIGAGLEGVRLRAEMHAMELGRMQAAVQGSWQ